MVEKILDGAEFTIHVRIEDGRTLYEFVVNVHSLNHIHNMLTNSLLISKFKPLYNKGNGLTYNP